MDSATGGMKRSFDLQHNLPQTVAARKHQLGPTKIFSRYTQIHSGTCTVPPRPSDCASQKPMRTDTVLYEVEDSLPLPWGAEREHSVCASLVPTYLASEAATPPLNKKQRDKPGTAILTFTGPWPRYVLFKGGEYVTQRVRVSLRCRRAAKPY